MRTRWVGGTAAVMTGLALLVGGVAPLAASHLKENPQNIEALELVVNGPALQNFVTKTMDPALKRALTQLRP
jgi:hypothetical protein